MTYYLVWYMVKPIFNSIDHCHVQSNMVLLQYLPIHLPPFEFACCMHIDFFYNSRVLWKIHDGMK